ncbi:GerAB/ArcD/ProY family transporter [Cohnella zeiphila]|uniref:GerAB/ArcD/ProY family transporter n=1 Tax=Cohnella zeiphila TaxID=2761120 RepID=A0A7X0SRW4_9BACL|nr:GerAB/ArcD/ProY family transporter [Cohnella zeiphila]MBB6734997.1 GerAB/ArcD/ProY family transporter [Cohnella zeiphila]
MNRYFVYLVFLNMLVNIVSYVPQILIGSRFQGAIWAILASVPIGMLLIYTCLKSMSRFPRQGLTDILDSILPRWIGRVLLLMSACQFFMAGCISLLSIADTSIRYISPETPLVMGIFMFLIVICMAAVHRTKQVLYLVEIILFIDVPLILFIIVKAFWNRSYDWDAVATVGMSYSALPTWTALSAATYIFSGYSDLVVVHKAFKQTPSPKSVWLFGALGLAILFASFSIPIAFQGADGVSDYIYPWIITADSMRVELGIVERVLPLFLLLYSGISLGSIIVRWHIASDLLKDCLPSSWSRKKPLTSWIFFAFFASVSLVLAFFFNENNILAVGRVWLNFRLPSEVLIVALILIAARRRRTS